MLMNLDLKITKKEIIDHFQKFKNEIEKIAIPK